MGNQMRYSAEYKATVALAALRGENSLETLAGKFGVPPRLIKQWEEQVLGQLVGIFSMEEPDRMKIGWTQVPRLSVPGRHLSKEERAYFSPPCE
jgi:transposase-like protein